MTREEMKAAFMDGCPVMHNGITYRRISAIIYRKAPGGKSLTVCAELLDRNDNIKTYVETPPAEALLAIGIEQTAAEADTAAKE